MDTAQPSLISAPANPGAPLATTRRRSVVTLKLLFIAALVLLLQLPLGLINTLRQERSANRTAANARIAARSEDEATYARSEGAVAGETRAYNPAVAAVEGYRMVERALKHSMLVLTLIFAAFFLFETLAGLRLHAVHYGLVGAAMCLFYLALLALGEVLPPGPAYIAAAIASSLLIVGYSASILRSWARATSIAALLTAEYGVLYIVLRMENYALLAGTTALFVVLAALMYFTRNVDWFAQEAGKEARA
jgi:inner membrane protein involved in colicin E2 resistance